jgi:hypothetical protein
VSLQFRLVGRPEVIRHGGGCDRFSVWLVLLCAVLHGDDLEVLESTSISSGHLELGRHISCHGQLFSCRHTMFKPVQNLLLAFEFFALCLSEVLLVGRATSERLLVDGELRGPLDEGIALAILPVRVFVLVTGVADIGSSHLVPRVRVSTITFTLRVEQSLKVVPVDRAQIHSVTVDSFVLLFQVESHLVTGDICALNLAVELLGVCGALLAGVGISNKPVSNASLFRSSITGFERIHCTWVWDPINIRLVLVSLVTSEAAISRSRFNLISIFYRL